MKVKTENGVQTKFFEIRGCFEMQGLDHKYSPMASKLLQSKPRPNGGHSDNW